MKKLLLRFIRDNIHNYIEKNIDNCFFEINLENNSLNFILKNKIPFVDSYLMVRNQNSGKRILKLIKNSKTQLNLDEINQFEELGVFEIYLRIDSFGKSFLNKIKFNSQNKNKFIVDYKNFKIFESFRDINSNLSFNFHKSMFYANAYEFKQETDSVVINGELNLIKSFNFDSVELRIHSDENRIDIPCTYKQNSNKILFESKIKFDLIEGYLFDDFNIEIKLKQDNIILDQCKIKGYSLSSNSIVNGQFLGFFKNPSKFEDSNLCDLFYLDYDFNLVCTVLDINEIDKFTRNKKILYSYNFENSKKPIVFFESFHGKFYAGQPKYIYEKMIDLNYDDIFDFVWAYDGEVEIPGKLLYVKHNSKEYDSFLKKADYLVSNIDFPILKNNNQIYLQTTHGTPYKYLGADITSLNPKIKKGRVLLESSTWNYLLSPSDYAEKTFRRCFEYDGVVINRGYPANDIFYEDNSEKILKLKNKFGIDENKKVILYAPTFRDYNVGSDKKVNFDLLIDLNKFYESLSDEYTLILRLHYLLSENLNLDSEMDNFIIDLSNHDDVNDLYLVSDILITDFSSVFFDFAHSKKPILFYVPDFDKYSEFRGLYDEVKNDLPGKEIIDTEDLINCIENIEEYTINYDEKYEQFYNKYCGLGHGTSSNDVVNIVFGDELNEH